MNEVSQQEGPLDYLDLDFDLGIQLKTIGLANNWSTYKSTVKKGLDQLNKVISENQCTTGRLDVMMPDALKSQFQDLQERLMLELVNSGIYPQFKDLKIVDGSFIE